MSTYAPGTVAVATVRGVEGVRVMRLHDDRDWVSADFVEGARVHRPRYVTDVRPLVVLDPDEQRFDPGILARVLRERTAYSRLAEALESFNKPPRIDEPGLWGVVEASRQYLDGKGFGPTRWVNTSRAGQPWYAPQFDVFATWNALVDPSLIREGVES